MRDCLEKRKDVYEVVYRIKKSDGDYLRFYDYGKISYREGEKIRLIGFVFGSDEGGDWQKQAEGFKKLVEEGDLVELFDQARAGS